MTSTENGPHSQVNLPSRLPPEEQLIALRILDANYNRAMEGLRVVEEYCRFALADRHLAGCCKSLRHRLADAFTIISLVELQGARDSAHDVGADVTTLQESQRESVHAVATASWRRVEQALRAIEEYAKLISDPLSTNAKELRYESYVFAKACLTSANSAQRMAQARLYVLIDGGVTVDSLQERVKLLVAAGVHLLQLRDKQLGDRDLLIRARLVRELTRGSNTLFVMNDRPDLAQLAGADGVHVGQEELPVFEVRRNIGPQMLIGVSTHSIHQARQAVLDGANYIGCGPTFPSGTKTFAEFPGLEFLRQVAEEISLPAFAIGGINRQNLPQVLATGISRVAVSGAVITAKLPAEEAKAFLNQLCGD